MSTSDDDVLLGALERIAALAVAQHTVQSMLDTLVSVSKELLNNADGTGLTLSEAERWTTAAASDDFVVALDVAQYKARNGPCLSAARENRLFRIDEAATEDRWPQFTGAAAAAGVRSILSVPLSAGDAAVGALNIYAFTPNAFDGDSEKLATILARHATIALANRAALGDGETLTRQLREALHSRELIGQAKGILMERDGLSSDDAFDALRRRSQAENRKLRDIAQDTVSEIEVDSDG